jgi:hypothetical protein
LGKYPPDSIFRMAKIFLEASNSPEVRLKFEMQMLETWGNA